MDTVRLGRTGLIVNKNGFGALPVQRISKDEGARLLRKAYEQGVNYFDTARAYSDSEEKMGMGLSDVRDQIIIATKTHHFTVEGFWNDLKTSLKTLKTDHIDIYQFHNPAFCPKPGDGSGLYEAMLEAKKTGLIRFIGFTNHRLALAREAVESGLYDTLQFPLSYLASEKEIELVKLCQERDVGFICMKALAGGLIRRSDAAYAFLNQYPVLPIWGIQKESELDEFLSYQEKTPVMNDEMMAFIEKERTELVGDFCRGCGYCQPCPAGIEIENCARTSLLLRRAPTANLVNEAGIAKMMKIKECIHCNQCASRCPYGLNTPALLQKNLEDFLAYINR
ncbi:MAG: aldo/keto reductase [Clostridiales bacterium]|nr:aldo/keto reductase [Clostridiales bacterium]